MSMWLKRMGFALVNCWLFLGLPISTSASAAISTTSGLLFMHDSSFDNRRVTSDEDSQEVVAASVTECAVRCQLFDWCASFFYNNSPGACYLHATVFVGPAFAEMSTGTRYYKVTEDWCPSATTQALYIRPADMCVYFEMDSLASTLEEADNACIGKGMKLAYNISPLRMSALQVVTQKNKREKICPIDTYNKSTFIGLKRVTPGQTTLQWFNGQALDTAALAPFWEVNQPNGHNSGQNCVVMRASVDSTLNDVTCGPHAYVCELLPPSST